jgi:EmrB/QacA subfamily drug resistance transporter
MDIETPQRQSYKVTFIALAVSTLAYVLLQSMVLPALPAFEKQLHTTADGATWVLTAYLLSASVATPILGRLGDIYGKEKVLVLVLGALTAGTFLAAIANTLFLLVVARVVQGVAGAVFPLAFSIIRDEFPPERVSTGIGWISMLLGIGSGLGVVLGGVIVEQLSIHWLFWVPLPGIVLALIAAKFFIPESPVRSPGGVNIAGAFLLSGWLVTLLLAVSEGPTWGWGSAAIVGLEIATAILFFAWIRSELGARHPLVDIRMMRIPIVWWANMTALLLGGGMYASVVVIPPFVQTASSHGYGFGSSPAYSGLFLVPQSVGMLLVGVVNGPVTERIGAKAALVIGAILGAVSFGILIVAHSYQWQFFIATSVMGVGIGLSFAAMSNLVVEAVPEHQTGVATGMNTNIRTIGGAVGSQLVAAILASGVALGAVPHERAYVLSFGVLAVCFALAAGAASIIPSAARPALATAAS